MRGWCNELARSHDREPGRAERQTLHQGDPIAVYDVLEYLAGGMSEEEIVGDFPDLTRESIRACLAFAAARERRLASSSAA